jgi:cell division protein FtsW
LTVFGFLIFSSASLGLLSKHSIKYANVAFNQTFFGLCLGSIACFITSKIPFTFYKKYAFFLFLFGIFLTLLVFVPKIGFEHGGAKRWIKIASISFQPSEILKITYIIYLSAWISGVKEKIKTFTFGLLPFAIITAIVSGILLLQPDTDTLATAICAGLAILLVSGIRWRDLFILVLVATLSIGFVIHSRPYIANRIDTFINPEKNSLTTGYQIQKSLIAIGSGGIYGRGFGQSVQKFSSLPEPIGDSIFAVYAEEFGFLGSVFLLLLFVLFSFRGLKIAQNSNDNFARLLSLGIVILIISQAFVNISSMVGLFPLSGITLPFVSHGGTSLFMVLAESGIILSISKNNKK